MPAYVWNTNHRMWKVVPPFADSAAVLKAYITDPIEGEIGNDNGRPLRTGRSK